MAMRKILIITSKVTFVPKNYEGLLTGLLNKTLDDQDFFNENKLIVVFLDNANFKLLLKSLALILMGAPRIGWHLLKNIYSAKFQDQRKQILKNHKIQYFEFDSPNSIRFRNFLRTEKIDILINARTRFIYKKKTLHTPKLGAFNIHHGILPENRGTMCDLWALYHEEPVGFTLHQMNEKIDDGKIIKVIVHQEQHDKNSKSDLDKSIQQKNYTDYIYQSSLVEGETLFEFIKNDINIIEKQGIEFITKDNIPTKKPHSKNPQLKEIWKMKSKGLKL